MSSTVDVTIHASQFPESIRRDLLKSLRTRRVNHKFHYDSVKQTQKWLALHQACSPTRNDKDCQRIYEKGFAAAVTEIRSKTVHVVGLGCGGGQKDTRLVKRLKAGGKEVFYTPCDVSTAMVLTARQTALAVLPVKNCFPLVFDLATTGDLSAVLKSRITSHELRIITFFGMIPNFEPQEIMPKLAALVGPKDRLLFSANLAPGVDYNAGMKKILPQYDNGLTRDWLITFLFNLGVERRDGDLRFAPEEGWLGLKRVVARFQFKRQCRIEIEGEPFAFRRGEDIQLFFSYRYTPERVCKLLGHYKLGVCQQWITNSEEEGVFLVRRL
jgi:uncharacterized SAM-dependent methyltransferase